MSQQVIVSNNQNCQNDLHNIANCANNSMEIGSETVQKGEKSLDQKLRNPENLYILNQDVIDKNRNRDYQNKNQKFYKKNTLQFSTQKQTSTSIIMSSISQNHQQELESLKKKLKKKEDLIKYLQKKLGQQIIRSMKKMNTKIQKLQHENEELAENLRIIQKNNLKYLKSFKDQAMSPLNHQTNFNQKSTSVHYGHQYGKYKKNNTLQFLKNKVHPERQAYTVSVISESIQTDLVEKCQRQAQSDQDQIVLNLQKQNQGLKNLIGNLNSEIDLLKNQFSALKNNVQNCFQNIQEIEIGDMSPRKEIYQNNSYLPKSQVQTNYCQLLDLFQIQWAYYEKPKDVHQILLMQINNLQKQNKKMRQKFKKIHKQAKQEYKQKKQYEQKYEEQKQSNIKMKHYIRSVQIALQSCNEEIIKDKIKIYNMKLGINQSYGCQRLQGLQKSLDDTSIQNINTIYS